ncbi:MAG: phosphoglycerate dehydrogenase [Leptospiraceae bacterium]|nr:phosphoglycerate dehydrogenase [Leptospiraceae bacterium]
MPKIFVSTFPYGVSDVSPRQILENTGWEIKYNPHNRKLKPEELAEFAKDADGVIAGTENMNQLLAINPNLQFIARVGIGLDSVPLSLCREKGIKVSYTPDAVTPAVAELTVGLMIALTRFANRADREIRNDQWTRPVGKRIEHSNIGIIGFGRVGKKLVQLLSSFKPKEILVNDIKDKSEEIKQIANQWNISIQQVTKEEIYQSSDIISLHLPLYKKTKYMIDKKSLELFNKNSFLINTARGALIHEKDLFDALNVKQIKAAALDVFETEPYSGNLRALENIILTQHIGSCSFDCRYEMEIQAAEELIRFFKNETLLREVPDEEYEYQL